ncbi:hypothetical protein [uncultured Draconibacterium sp.]|uniref:hypothetical protein n=1 Tax=uncultured Draconibacterium sp. TaxID=1573823 RepID=UPI0029C6E04B|nr:hypothetical protein [uncultured Draconibacterium sp.]
MDRYASYKIIANHKMIIEYYSGMISINDIMLLKDILSGESDFDTTFKILHDFREADFQMDTDDIDKLVNFYVGHKVSGKRRAAYLTLKPNEVVYTTLFAMLVSKSLPINGKTFTTIKSAIQWLNVNNELEINKLLDTVKTLPNILSGNGREIK